MNVERKINQARGCIKLVICNFLINYFFKKNIGLKLKILGMVKVQWRKRTLKVEKFEGQHQILEHINYFFGKDGKLVEVSVGIHIYKFSCKVPSNVISSYDGTNGSVKYRVQVTLDIPTMPDIIHEHGFTILRIENLNNFPWLSTASEIENEHGVGMFYIIVFMKNL